MSLLLSPENPVKYAMNGAALAKEHFNNKENVLGENCKILSPLIFL